MVYENAIFTIPKALRAEFVSTVDRVGPTFLEWPGCSAIRLLHCVEVPERFILVITWESVESHMDFRASEGFKAWAEATAGYREVPVEMSHYEVVVDH